jgi:type II secretory pathway pseudopilin PulG
MSSCPRCGALVGSGSSFCPSCGQPLGGGAPAAGRGPGLQGVPGAPPKSSKGPLIAILLAVGCFFVLAVGGIIAAIFIPNFVDALNKAKVKRTMADLRSMSVAIASYATETGVYPAGQSIDDLAGVLEPQYLQLVPRLDGWKRPFHYQCLEPDWSASSGQRVEGCASYVLASAGRDGLLEATDLGTYEPKQFPLGEYDQDLVVRDSEFIRAPNLP